MGMVGGLRAICLTSDLQLGSIRADAGAKEEVRRHLAIAGSKQEGTSVQSPQAFFDLVALALGDQIDLIQYQEVGAFDLLIQDLVLGRERQKRRGIDHGDHRITSHASSLEAVDDGVGVGEAGGFDDQQVRFGLLDDLLHGDGETIVVDGAADTAAIDLYHRLHSLQAGDDLAVDADVADFIHDDGDPLLLQAMPHDVLEQRGLAASQKASQDITADLYQ